MIVKTGSIAIALTALALMPTAVQAQGSPVPGQSGANYGGGAANSYAAQSYAQAPVPGAAPNNSYVSTGGGSYAAPAGKPGKGAYAKLPLSADDAKVRIAELRNLLAVSRPQDVQESVFQLCEWLSDMADAHWKLSLALAKNDSMKAASAQERLSAVKFSSLKHEAGLLKAEIFIKQNRLPEALSPLVDIVVAEPKSIIGQAAYEKLKEIGFAEQAGDAAYSSIGRPAAKAVPAVISASQLKPVPSASAAKPARTAQATKTR
jgi:hypothetical protein